MQYYLYKQGSLTGPLSSEKIEDLKKTKKLSEYQWMMDSESQTWKSITDCPRENPFQLTQTQMKDRNLSAAFFVGKNPLTGNITKIHSFGVEILISNQKSTLKGLIESKPMFINLCDETNFTFINAKAILQSQEIAEDGLHLRFNWDQQEVSL